MFPSIKQWFTYPAFEDDEENMRRTRLLNAAMVASAIFLILVIPILWFSNDMSIPVILTDISALFVILILFWLLRRGKIKAAAVGYTLLIFLWATLLNINQGTIRTPATTMYLALVVGSGLLFKWRGILVSTLFSSLAIALLIWAENNGLLPTPNYSVSFIQWIAYTGLFGIGGSLSLYTNQIVSNALEKAREEIAERKQAEQTLRQSEEQKSAIIASVPDLLFWLRRDGVILDYHAPNDSMLYIPPSKFLNKMLDDVLPDFITIPARQAMEESLVTQRMVMFEYKIEKNGKTGYYEDRIIPVNNGEIFLSVIRNITDSRRAEILLRESEERFRRLADNAPDIIFRYNLTPERQLSYINPVVQTITGYTPEECYADPNLMINMAHPDDVWMMIEYMQGLKTPSEPVFMRWIGKDGLTRWMETRIVPIFDAAGQLTAVEGITRDITDRRHTEEALRVSEERFRQLITSAPDAIFGIDQDGKINFANTEATNLLGYSQEEFIGKNVDTLVPARVRNEHGMWRSTYNEQPYTRSMGRTSNLFAVNKDGSEIPVDIKLSHYRVEDQLQIIAFIQDITKRKQAEEALKASETRYRLLAENISDVIWILDVNEMRFRYVSPSVERLRGYTVEEVLAQDMSEALSPDSLKVLQENIGVRIQEFLNGHDGFDINEVEQPCKDGSTVWTEATTSFRINESNGHLEVYGVSRNINERKMAEKALREAEARWQFALEGSGDGIWDWNVQTNQVFYSHQWKIMLGYNDEEIGNLPDEWLNRVHPNELEMVENEIEKHLAGTTPLYISEYRILCKDGEYKWILDRGKVVEWLDNKTPLRFIGTQTDITQQKLTERQLRSQLNEIEHLQDELRQQALHDPLTNLYNRRFLSETLDRELNRSHRENKPISAIIMDIDLFKRINDTYGHQIGDKFLLAIADLLKAQVRSSDIACRYGGEEFLLVLPGTTAEAAFERAEQLRLLCAEIRIAHQNIDLSITVSMGIATYPIHAKDSEELLIHADIALYTSKHSGRNKVAIWSKA